MKQRTLLILLTTVCMACGMQAQTYNQMDPSGNITQRNESQNFNPNKRDSVSKSKEIPKGVWAWTVDRRFGDIRPAELDTMPHLYQNSIYATGVYGQYNTLGSNYTARQNRVFIDRKPISQFYFVDPYSYMTKEPDEFQFLNTLSPYTNISYDNCGDKQNGEDHIDAKFGVNANKRLGFGFDLDYHYARGYYQSQSTSHFRSALYGSYRGDHYQMHLLGTLYHRKATENGGIADDELIVHPEQQTTQYDENEIPTVLSQNWNRTNSQHLFLSHRYNLGFYRKVKMTDEEIKARQFARKSAQEKEKRKGNDKSGGKKSLAQGRNGAPVADDEPKGRPSNAAIAGDEPAGAKEQAADTARVKVNSAQQMDSLLARQAIQDSIDATMKREYVPVTSIIHTLDISHYNRVYQAYASPDDYYENTYYDLNDDGVYAGDSIYDKFRYTTIKNTVALALLEGFNKYVKAGLKGYVSYENRRFRMPYMEEGATSSYLGTYSDHCVSVGGQLSKRQGKTFHFDAGAEVGLTGMDKGALAADFATDLNFRLLGDTLRLAAKARFSRTAPAYFMENYHSKHLWWENDLSAETRTHVEGVFSYDKTNTQLRVAVDEIQNYTYFGMSYTSSATGRKGLTGGVYQESGNISLLTLQLRQLFRLGVVNWENVLTCQRSSNKEVLPLPSLNVFTNLFLKFMIARVLTVELGGCMTYYTKYYAPDYLPQIGQFAVQQNADARVETGGYPYVDVYANMHLKRARFFVSMTHVNAGSGSKRYFLTQHYPTNTRVLHLGVSWNFYN